jgi:4-amino-4-deoxy-L-arabinose transferase-like glycosyltransferase
MRELLRKNPRFFLFLTLGALLYRLYFAVLLPCLAAYDTYVYANLARTLLNHHVYGLSGDNGSFYVTLIRLPGYPYFLAMVFRLFGQDHWRAVMVVQAFVDTATCLVIAAIARRVINDRAAKIAFVLAAICPFTANYAGTVLTETLTIFCTSLAFLFAIIAFEEKRLAPMVGCGAALAYGILLRPDTGWLLGSIGLFMLLRMWVMPGERKFLFKAGVLVLAVSLVPLVPWTIRNWRVFHVFQPLVNPAALDPGETEPVGFERWMGTWIVDYSNLEDVAFHVSGEPVNFDDIPQRAFADAQEKEEVRQLIARYNDQLDALPDVDTEFGRIADRQIRAHPIRHYVVVPLLKVAGIWLRPRTEMLPIDTHWWRFRDDPHDSSWAIFLMLVNFGFLAIAMMGILRGPPMRYVGLFLMYLLVRTFFLWHMGMAEDRYTLECFPALFILGARYLAGWGEQPLLHTQHSVEAEMESSKPLAISD